MVGWIYEENIAFVPSSRWHRNTSSLRNKVGEEAWGLGVRLYITYARGVSVLRW